jgi:hypothetical protein
MINCSHSKADSRYLHTQFDYVFLGLGSSQIICLNLREFGQVIVRENITENKNIYTLSLI